MDPGEGYTSKILPCIPVPLFRFPLDLENLEKWKYTWKTCKYHGILKNSINIMEKWHETWKNLMATKNSPLTPLKWFLVQIKLNKFAYLYSKPLGNHTLKIMKKIPEHLLKNLEKIMEISWNFISPKKWEPCLLLQININYSPQQAEEFH